MKRSETRSFIKRWLAPRMPAWTVSRRECALYLRMCREIVLGLHIDAASGESRYFRAPYCCVHNLLDFAGFIHLDFNARMSGEHKAYWQYPIDSDGSDVAEQILEYVERLDLPFFRQVVDVSGSYEYLSRLAAERGFTGSIPTRRLFDLAWLAAWLERWDESAEWMNQSQKMSNECKTRSLSKGIEWTEHDAQDEQHREWFLRCLRNDRPAIHEWFEKNIAGYETRGDLPPIHQGDDPFVILPPR